MTCYEALSVREGPPPTSAADAPMAHHLVKWWRNKFRSGYKKFHLSAEGERTDTEELVGRAASQCSAMAPPDLLPSDARALLQPASPRPRRTPPPPSPPPPATRRLPSPLIPHLVPPTAATASATAAATPAPAPHHDKPPRLRFEELTCDVSVQETPSLQPLQFSFTLYDLDGHGRMTKDDIAGIVSTIYESVGKSVTVPHYGSKTIQVRLTVVPESAAPPAAGPAAPDRAGAPRREGRRRARRRKETASGAPPDCGDATDDERRSRLSVDDESSCSGERRRVRTRAARPPPPAQPPRVRDKERDRRPSKKRSGSLQRRELLQIIQTNMEKNRLSFQNSRKPHERVIHEEEKEKQSPKQRRHRDRSYTVSAKPLSTAACARTEPPAPHGYLDLARPSPPSPRADPNLCRYDRYLHAVICSSATHAHSGYHQKHLPTTPPVPAGAPAASPRPHKTPRTRHRSRSHDVPPPPAPPPPPPPPPPPLQSSPRAAEPRVLQIIFL